jgi:hypothetical protein
MPEFSQQGFGRGEFGAPYLSPGPIVCRGTSSTSATARKITLSPAIPSRKLRVAAWTRPTFQANLQYTR